MNFSKTMRIFLTGSSGYLGRHLSERLISEGHEVVGLDRVKDHHEHLDDFVHGDLNKISDLENYLINIDCIFHLAAAKDDWGLSREEYFRDNLEASKKIVDTGKKAGIKKWVFYSTVSVLGPSEKALDETAPHNPEIPYGESKAEAERLFVNLENEISNSEILIIRPSAIFSAGNPPVTNIYRLIDAIYKKRFLMVGSGDNQKTTSYLPNLIEANIFLFNKMKAGANIYQYVDYPIWSTRKLVNNIYDQLGKKRNSLYIPLTIAKPIAYASDIAAKMLSIDFPITADRIEKFCTSTKFKADKIRKEGFKQPVDLEQAVANTVNWHINMLEKNIN
jgi:nucleoside-diphosphate-sugar epimerase